MLSLRGWSLLGKTGLGFCTDDHGEVKAREVVKCGEKEGREKEGYGRKRGNPASSLATLEEPYKGPTNHCGMAQLALLPRR